MGDSSVRRTAAATDSSSRRATSQGRLLPPAGRRCARGFAVLSSDAGHSAEDPANKALGLAASSAFGLDPQARRDYGYAADVTLAPIAKAIIAAHYGRKPDFSYMFGCSNGGRHTMVAATRMPEAYDGFLVGDPGLDLPRAAIRHAWDAQAFVKADPDLRKSITKEDGELISRKIIAACDKLDGLEDGLTGNLAACQKAFNFDSLICAPGATADCLPKAKVEALKMSFAGPKNSRGDALYSDWPVDGGVGMGNWRMWKIESPVPPWDHYPIIATMGASSLQYIFTTPPTPVAGSTDALMKSLLEFNFDRDAPKIYARTDAFPQSAMEFMTPPDADDPKLTRFRELGRKMIIYHGQADPVFSIDDTIRWYDRLNANLDGRAEAEVRLFAVPGMTHCRDGVTLDKFDALTALVDWVEKGKAPDRIIASVDPANKEVPASWSPTWTRPLCPWPKYARYKSGDPESADSFECTAP
jgi:feruloyl esterase